jgi:hypothetical protein
VEPLKPQAKQVREVALTGVAQADEWVTRVIREECHLGRGRLGCAVEFKFGPQPSGRPAKG